jgi:hypothetical protein
MLPASPLFDCLRSFGGDEFDNGSASIDTAAGIWVYGLSAGSAGALRKRHWSPLNWTTGDGGRSAPDTVATARIVGIGLWQRVHHTLRLKAGVYKQGGVISSQMRRVGPLEVRAEFGIGWSMSGCTHHFPVFA